MIDEKLDERIQKFATARVRDSDFGVQPTQSLADTQGEAPPVAQNVPTPTRPALPSVQTRTDTSLPNVRAGSVYRDASGLHTGQYVTQKDFEEGQAQVEAYKRAHPERTGYRPRVTSNRYRGDSWNRPPQTFAPSATVSRQGAAQFRQAAQQPAQTVQPVNRIQQIDQRAEAEAKAQAEKREQARRDANVSVGEAFSEALRKFRDDSTAITRNGRERIVEKDANGNELRPGVNGYEAKYRDSANRYRIGMLQPSTIRALNQQRSALGLKESDSIVGIYAVSGVDANGKQTGEPQIVTNYRSADGRIHKKVYTYQEAARFVRGTMGDKGDASADDRFASMKQWQDADGNDALGITRTAEYQERRAKQEAAVLKNDLTRQQIAAANKPESERLLDRADALAGKDPEQSAAYRQQAQIAAANEEIARRKAANGSSSVHKSNPQKAGSEGAGQKPQKPGAKPPTVSGESASESAPPAATSVQEKPPTASGKDTEELDYDSPAMQAQVKKDIESGGGKYSEDDEGNRTIRIGNWDYLSDADKKIVREVQADENGDIDIRAVHAMQKKANEAKTAFDKKRKAEEDKFRESLKGKGLTSVAIDNRVKKHMMGWDARNDPKKKRQINDSRFSGFVSDF